MRNHNSGDGKKKEKKEKKKKEEEIEVEDEDECREFVTGNLCWVASLLLQLHTTPTLSSSSSQFVFLFSNKSFDSRSEKSPKCMPAKSLISVGIC